VAVEQADAAVVIAHEALLAEHLDIAAERQERELEAGALPVNSRPKPTEKASTRTPHRRATMKWPSSCTRVMTSTTPRNGSEYAITVDAHDIEQIPVRFVTVRVKHALKSRKDQVRIHEIFSLVNMIG
jgi:hypothetical protein